MRTSLTSGLLLALLLPAALVQADWPTYQHNNSRNGATTEKVVPPLKLAWTYQAPGDLQLAWSGPRDEPIEGQRMRHRVAFDDCLHVVAAGNRAYFGSSVDHQVYCVDAATGRTVWTFSTDGPVRLAPTVSGDRVYVGSDDGCVYCLDAGDGSVIWKQRVGPADERLLARGRMICRWPVRTGVLVDDGTAYFAAGVFPHETVYLCAADAATGKMVWKNDRISQQDAGRNAFSPQGYLLASDKVLFVPSGRAMPAAFDRATGEMKYQRQYSWRDHAGGVVGGSAAVLGDNQIYSSGPHHFLAIQQQTGGLGHSWMRGRQMTIVGTLAYFANGKQVYAVDRAQHAAASIERQKLFVKRRLFRRDPQKLAQIDKQMAEFERVGILWRSAFEGDAALVVSDNLVLAGGPNRVAAFDRASGDELAKFEVDGLASGIAVSDGRVYVSTDAGKIYCFADAEHASDEIFAWGVVEASPPSPYPQDERTAVYQAAAENILQHGGQTRGFCLIVGSEHGRLAYELARRSELTIVGLEEDAAKVQTARAALHKCGLYGQRVVIVNGKAADTTLPNYFANLVVSDSLLSGDGLPAAAADLARYVKPCGGRVCLSTPPSAPLAGELRKLLADINVPNTRIEGHQRWATLTRGKLGATGNWTHQYADAGNTGCAQESIVKGNLSVLWYGDPGPGQMVNRHSAVSAPLSTAGRMFVQGLDNVRAYDVYNGQFLWEYKNPQAIRTGVFNNEEVSNLAANDESLFIAEGDTCSELDAATGTVRRVHSIPPHGDESADRVWGYVALAEGRLFGTSVVRKELDPRQRTRGRNVSSTTDTLFAVDLASGERLWTHRGQHVMHMTIAIGDGRVFFIDSSISPEERQELLQGDKTKLKDLTDEQARKAADELKQRDVRRAVCLDAATGEQLWSQPVDVTDCSRIGIGGGQLTLMYHRNRVVICGANANGHFWKQFLAGEFSRRRLLALDARTGEKLWDRDANYRHRPLIVGRKIFAEPWAFDLDSGAQETRMHPITGAETPWQFSRPGHHCGAITATPEMLLFRSGFTAFYDLYADSGTRHFAGHRLGCWINAIPGNGLVMIPEASAGCVCQFPIAATVVLEPRAERAGWGLYSAAGATTPVKHLALNLGAPGDRRDQQRQLWLAYPRPRTVGRLELTFHAKAAFAQGGGFYQRNGESLAIASAKADRPWLYASGARGLARLEVPLLGKNDAPATYQVRLHFVSSGNDSDAPFDVKLQGHLVAQDLKVTSQDDGPEQTLVREFSGVAVSRNLAIELVRRGDAPKEASLPSLAAVEIERRD